MWVGVWECYHLEVDLFEREWSGGVKKGCIFLKGCLDREVEL